MTGLSDEITRLAQEEAAKEPQVVHLALSARNGSTIIYGAFDNPEAAKKTCEKAAEEKLAWEEVKLGWGATLGATKYTVGRLPVRDTEADIEADIELVTIY